MSEYDPMDHPVDGFCPACGAEALYLDMGVPTCFQKGCPNPKIIYGILSDPEIHHVLEVLSDVETEQSGRWTLKHPLRERVDGDLFDCEFGKALPSFLAFRQLPEPGRYRIRKAADGEPGLWQLPWEKL